MFQAYNLIPVLSAYENAEVVLALQGVPPEVRRERVMATHQINVHPSWKEVEFGGPRGQGFRGPSFFFGLHRLASVIEQEDIQRLDPSIVLKVIEHITSAVGELVEAVEILANAMDSEQKRPPQND